MVVQRLFLCLIFCAIRPIWFVFTLSCCSFSYSNYVSRSLEVIRQCRERERESESVRRDFTMLCCLDEGLQPTSTIRALDFTFCVCMCACVCAQWPQLRLLLPSNSMCLTATGSHLWPLGCLPCSLPPCWCPVLSLGQTHFWNVIYLLALILF